MPETSPRIGLAIGNITRADAQPSCRSCLVFKRPALLQFFTTALSRNRKRWRRRFALAIPQVGNRPARQLPSQMARLTLLATKKFSRRRRGWPGTREFLWNRPVRPRLPGFSNAAIQRRQHIQRFQHKAELFAP